MMGAYPRGKYRKIGENKEEVKGTNKNEGIQKLKKGVKWWIKQG